MSAEHAIEPASLAQAKVSPRAAEAPKAVKAARPQAPAAVLVLSYARVVPFVATALIIALSSPSSAATSALAAEMAYGAVLLSFLGGARWGAAIRTGGEQIRFRPLALLLLPTLFSWCVIFMAPKVALAALMAGFLLLALAERLSARQDHGHEWRGGLEVALTILTEMALGASLAALFFA
ncbi:MAG: DUF3429 domain-containing protein [Parvibaculum sp.]|uniref:DUF3429 domain-containing protein n=1 Tax=Parvibaculum sp. TaxID=2024848 RepID=UPI0028449216|nr:DUF3429 domain-containing protein [Parvibaculum sp.]MDR3498881.1 DUF3429 domain-containing protein [Parvibaculum sp.]